MFSTNTDWALSLISTFFFKHIAIVARIDKLNTSLCTFICNLQSQVQTHAVLVIGLYELLGNPTN
jgi:hypothetical protein